MLFVLYLGYGNVTYPNWSLEIEEGHRHSCVPSHFLASKFPSWEISTLAVPCSCHKFIASLHDLHSTPNKFVLNFQTKIRPMDFFLPVDSRIGDQTQIYFMACPRVCASDGLLVGQAWSVRRRRNPAGAEASVQGFGAAEGLLAVVMKLFLLLNF